MNMQMSWNEYANDPELDAYSSIELSRRIQYNLEVDLNVFIIIYVN